MHLAGYMPVTCRLHRFIDGGYVDNVQASYMHHYSNLRLHTCIITMHVHRASLGLSCQDVLAYLAYLSLSWPILPMLAYLGKMHVT